MKKLTQAQHALLMKFPYVVYHDGVLKIAVSRTIYLVRGEYATARALEKRGFVTTGTYGPAALTEQGKAYVQAVMSEVLAKARLRLNWEGIDVEKP